MAETQLDMYITDYEEMQKEKEGKQQEETETMGTPLQGVNTKDLPF